MKSLIVVISLVFTVVCQQRHGFVQSNEIPFQKKDHYSFTPQVPSDNFDITGNINSHNTNQLSGVKAYSLGKKLGAGKFSTVYQATSLRDGKEVAIKILNQTDLNKIRRETHVLNILKGSDHIIKLYEVIFEELKPQTTNTQN
ncbi:MAG: hypothetical protein EZS28_051574, partial [Streblomastix strix]